MGTLSLGNMKKIFKVLFIVIVFLFGITNVVSAGTDITLKIYAGDTVLWNGPISVEVCAESPAGDAPITANGKCAVEQTGLSNTWTWNYAPSGWLDELGGYTTTEDYTKSWGWFNNLNYGNVALNQHVLSSGEELLLTYNSFPLQILASKTSGKVGDTIIFTVEEKSTFDENYDMPWTKSLGATATLGNQSCITISDGTCSIVLNTPGSLNVIGSKTLYVPSNNINIEIVPVRSGGGGGLIAFNIAPVVVPEIKPSFNTDKAFEFLISQQKGNGSFGEDIFTDWVAVALASSPDFSLEKEKVKNYLLKEKFSSSVLTDYERRSIALMALGINPYDISGENYIKKITDSFNGKQFGDVNEDNDDIFALIVLQNSGFTTNDKIIEDDIAFILNRQKENGSWDNSVDMTGAGIEALTFSNRNEKVANALQKAKDFLKQKQKDNGGWGNASSTAWAMEGIVSFNEKFENWVKNGNTPLDYLAVNQDVDGGIKGDNMQNRIWETSYVLSVLSGKNWMINTTLGFKQ